jgi:ribosomal protein S27AE
MAIYSEIGAGQRLYLENQGDRTIVTLASGSAGQQQQASSGLQTGVWTARPRIYQTPGGVMATITTATGDYSLQIQGASVQMTAGTPILGDATLLPSQQTEDRSTGVTMQPMQPMQPMKMGNMEMSLQPMQMRMGNMAMTMGETVTAKRQFCSQCGAKVGESDRFCSHCGHQLA